MWRNYLHIFLRQLLKFKSIYSINILGLAFGLACCLTCYLHIRYQYSFDRFHKDSDKLYRLVTGDPASSDSWVKMAPPISPKLRAEIPAIEEYVRFSGVTYSEKVMVECNGSLFLEPDFRMADPAFFRVFNYPLLRGNVSTVLSDLSSVALSETTAAKLFGKEDPLGKMVRLKDAQLDFQVSGIFKDPPSNTHLKFDYLISFDNLDRIFGKGSLMSWGQYNYFAYLKLQAGADAKKVESEIQSRTVQLPDREAISFKEFHLQPVTDIHFVSNRGNELPSTDRRYLYVFATLAVSVLIICFMNYFNVAAMLSIKRIKEIGVRKSIGATSRQVSTQFILESTGVAFLSLALSLLVVEALKPHLSTGLDSAIVLDYSDRFLLLFLLGITALLALVSGGYLTLYVNQFRPGAILKGLVSKGGRNMVFQNSLIFVQSSISTILLISSTIIVQQMNFMRHKDLGFDKEQMISVTLPNSVSAATLTSLQTELTNSSQILDVAFSDFVPGKANWHQTTWWEGQTTPEAMYIMAIGKDFIPAMKIQLVEGTVDEIKDSQEIQYLINESALKQIGWTTGKGRFLSPFGESRKKTITGVVKDFNYRSLHTEVSPLVLVVYPDRIFSKLTVRLAAGQLQGGIKTTERIYRSVTGGLPFEFEFMDDRIDALYDSEIKMQNVLVILTVIAVCFALLGIYTMISFAIENRAREIAIRKVLGISQKDLITLFTSSYFKIVLVSSLVAIPVCWKLLNDWLMHINTHIELNFLNFLAVIFLMIVLVGGIGFTKYASIVRINPVNSLRND